MGEFDTKAWTEGARYVARLRRRIWHCQLGMVAALLFLVPFFAFWHDLKLYLHGIVIAMFFLVASACLLVGNATWFELIGFRCPRCGQHFIRAFWIGFYSNRCKHCGLDLGPGAIAKAKPLDLADF
jgi:hypothetical protein